MDRWRVYLVGYLVWLILFTVVEGAGREVCRMPTKRWIAAGADARDRTMRGWFRDRATECLDATAWYRSSIAGLFAAGLLAPFAAAWLLRKRPVRAALVFIIALGLTPGTMGAVRWLYDWYA